MQPPVVFSEWDASAEGAPGDRAAGAQQGHGHWVPAASKGLPIATPLHPAHACTPPLHPAHTCSHPPAFHPHLPALTSRPPLPAPRLA